MKQKSGAAVGRFLREHYGISLRSIMGKLRAGLLDDLEEVPCNRCGGSDREIIGRRDKYDLPVVTVRCTTCGLLYLNPRPTEQSYRKHYESGGSEESVYHRLMRFRIWLVPEQLT